MERRFEPGDTVFYNDMAYKERRCKSYNCGEVREHLRDLLGISNIEDIQGRPVYVGKIQEGSEEMPLLLICKRKARANDIIRDYRYGEYVRGESVWLPQYVFDLECEKGAEKLYWMRQADWDMVNLLEGNV